VIPVARTAPPQVRAPRIAALVLAAGRSRRMRGTNKLLDELDGRAMVARVVETVLEARCAPVLVVTGHQRARVEAVLDGCPVEWVHNPRFAAGLGGSLAAGAAALPADIDAVLVCLGDMPLVRAAHIERLVEAFDATTAAGIRVPVHAGRRGHPVLFSKRYFGELGELDGERGARPLLTRHAHRVCEVEMDDDGVLIDIDNRETLRRLRSMCASD